MDFSKYKPKNLEELEKKAQKWWPQEVLQEIAPISPVELLLETFPRFRDVVVQSRNVEEMIQKWKESYPLNLLLKHIMVFTDVGGEVLQRVSKDRRNLFPDARFDARVGDIIIPIQMVFPKDKFGNDVGLSNKTLGVDGESLARIFEPNRTIPQEEAVTSAIYFLCYSSFASNPDLADTFRKCNFASFLGGGDPESFDKACQTKYIEVSRITGGASANASGQVCQARVKKYLEEKLKGCPIKIETNARREIGGTAHTSDIFLEHAETGKAVGIEVAFQVTTNSTIERKANESEQRYKDFERAWWFVAYVLDGIGNFQRKHACEKLIKFSHCTVPFTEEGLSLLAEFVKEALNLASP